MIDAVPGARWVVDTGTLGHWQKLDATTRQRYAYGVANPEGSDRIFVKKVQDANQ